MTKFDESVEKIREKRSKYKIVNSWFNQFTKYAKIFVQNAQFPHFSPVYFICDTFFYLANPLKLVSIDFILSRSMLPINDFILSTGDIVR